MTKTKRQYKIKQELTEEQKQELLNKRIERAKSFGNSGCIGRYKRDDGRIQCKYTGNKDCGRNPINSISCDDPKVDIMYCMPDTRDYLDRI